MADRIMTQIRFRKGIFTCKCGQEDIVDWSPSGGNTYENNCSACGKWTNSFKNYDGCLTMLQDEYDKMTEEDIIKKKNEGVDKFIYDQKNPPEYVEPSVKDYESMIDGRLEEVGQYLEAVKSKASKAELEGIKAKIDAQSSNLQTSIEDKG